MVIKNGCFFIVLHFIFDLGLSKSQLLVLIYMLHLHNWSRYEDKRVKTQIKYVAKKLRMKPETVSKAINALIDKELLTRLFKGHSGKMGEYLVNFDETYGEPSIEEISKETLLKMFK